MTSRCSGTVDKSGIITLLQESILKRSLCHKWRSPYDREDLEIVKQQMYAFHASIGGYSNAEVRLERQLAIVGSGPKGIAPFFAYNM